MSLSNLVVREQYTGDGANTTFAIPADPVFDDSTEIKVYVGDTLQTEGAIQDYTLTGAPDTDSFHVNVEFNTAPANGAVVTVLRDISLTQALDLISAGTVNLATLEKHLDGIVAKIQQVNEELRRAPKLKVTSALEDVNLPDPMGEYVLRWNAAGTDLEAVSAAEAITGSTGGSYSEFTEHSVSDGQSATDLAGETVDGDTYSSAVYEYEIKRGTTVLANGRISLQYLNSTWVVNDGGYEANIAHGVTFSVSQITSVAQLRAALDSGAGNGTIKLSRRLIEA